MKNKINNQIFQYFNISIIFAMSAICVSRSFAQVADETKTIMLDTGIKRITTIKRNKKGDITEEIIEDFKNKQLIRSSQASLRYGGKEGGVLEKGTTIRKYNKKGIIEKVEFIHDEYYKNVKKSTSSEYEYYDNDNIKQIFVEFNHSNKINNFIRIEKFYDAKILKFYQQPIKKGNEIIGIQKGFYNYYDNWKLKSYKVQSFDNKENLIEEEIYLYNENGSVND